MKLDKYQQDVINCETNAVVSAGAGSGKTTVLAERFLRIVGQGKANVSEILTLTFTRKAAAEMYERIYGLLVANRTEPAVSAAVAEFDKAVISTLDSFCSRIARDCSGMFGLPSTFTTDESSVRELAEDVSLDFILKNASNRSLQDFIYINGFENVWQNFFVYVSLDYLAMGAPVDFGVVFDNQIKTAEGALEQTAGQADSLIADILAIEPVSKSIETAREILRNIKSFSELSEDRQYTDLRAAADAAKLKKPGGRASKEEIIRFKELVDALNATLPVVSDLAGTLENRDLLKGLFELTADFQEELFSSKRAAGLLGFHDVLTIAVSGLKRDKSLRRYYKGLFRYIMIDEFQDNNLLQKELLYLLAEEDETEGDGVPPAGRLNPDKLFFVGDEKQSIYRFRGADVSVFKQLGSEITETGGRALALKRNYRSEPGLIHFFNRVFGNVMRESTRDYEAVFEPLEPRDAVLPSPPEIKILYKPYDPGLSEDSLAAEESEAAALADYILGSVGRLSIAENGVARLADFSDFAVIFRSGTNQKTYEQVFRSKGIPYNVHSVRSLFQEAPVNDIYNLLQICIYPDDTAASAAFLRSPFVNLSDLSVLEFLVSGRRVFDEGMEACCRSENDLEKYRCARELYLDICSRLDREPLSDIITDIWYKSGYRYLILGRSSLHGYLEYFDYLKQLAVGYDQDKNSAAGFLDYIRSNLGEYKKIDNLKILGYSVGGVEMMPVHQAKGLEFPVVIIANSGNVGLNDRGGSSPAYISEADGLSFNLVPDNDVPAASSGRCNYFYSRGKEENRLRDEAELRRLLYVAMTRAGSHLVISGCHGRQNRSGEKSMLNMLLKAFGWNDGDAPLVCPELGPYIDEIENKTWTSDNGLRKDGKADIPAISKLYAEASPASYSFIKNEFSATELNAIGSPPEQSGIRELPLLDSELETLLTKKKLEAEFGTLSHRIIEYCIKGAKWPSMPSVYELEKDLRPFFPDHSDGEWKQMVQGAGGLARGFFSSEIWKIAAGALGVESELAFTALNRDDSGEVFVNGVMDLVFELGESVRIVDFKTDRRIVPNEYRKQMEIYTSAAEALYSKPAFCSLFYLRGGIEVASGV